jgi:hypothetical protein
MPPPAKRFYLPKWSKHLFLPYNQCTVSYRFWFKIASISAATNRWGGSLTCGPWCVECIIIFIAVTSGSKLDFLKIIIRLFERDITIIRCVD